MIRPLPWAGFDDFVQSKVWLRFLERNSSGVRSFVGLLRTFSHRYGGDQQKCHASRRYTGCHLRGEEKDHEIVNRLRRF